MKWEFKIRKVKKGSDFHGAFKKDDQLTLSEGGIVLRRSGYQVACSTTGNCFLRDESGKTQHHVAFINAKGHWHLFWCVDLGDEHEGGHRYYGGIDGLSTGPSKDFALYSGNKTLSHNGIFHGDP